MAEAENTAARKIPNVVAIDNSWDSLSMGEVSTPKFEDAFNHKHIAIVVAAGDEGYGDVISPADYNTVTSVVGSSLRPCYSSCGSRAWNESVWNSNGRATASGCSTIIAAQLWQTAIESVQSPPLTGCSMRVIGDVAYDADPDWGVGVYCSYIPENHVYPCAGSSSHDWTVQGGTSVGAPAIAGLYALAGNTGAGGKYDYPAEMAYINTSSFYDITDGNNILVGSHSCSGDLYWLCHAEVGYDAPSGVGSPDGIGGF